MKKSLIPTIPPETSPSPRLMVGILISLCLHAILIFIHFSPTKKPKPVAQDTGLEIILVNASTNTAPANTTLLAQTNLDAGGQDEAGRAHSPLPPSPTAQEGEQLFILQQKQAELEAQQRALLTQLKNNKDSTNTIAVGENAGTQAYTAPDASTLLTRRMAEISDRIEDYNKRPRKHFFAPSASEYRFAKYVEYWRARVELIGNENYPPAARGRYYGKLRMTVYIRANGQVEKVEIDQPSEHEVLNQAAKDIIRLSAPFQAFPPDIAKDTDILAITRTWRFSPESLSASAD